MKANFALLLSLDGIRLLHRAAGGWRPVGDVALGSTDLDAEMTALRRTALNLEPAGLRTKIVLPHSQVRYITIDTVEREGVALRMAAAEALDDATPYRAEELVFDLSPDGARTHVAAAARETIAEAEAFAVAHKLAPISVVSRPAQAPFLGEPFFGPTAYSQSLLAPGEVVEPDGIAVVELDVSEASDGPVVDVEDGTPPVASTGEDVGATPQSEQPGGSGAKSGSEPVAQEFRSLPAVEPSHMADPPGPRFSLLPDGADAAERPDPEPQASLPSDAEQPDDDDAITPGFASRRADRAEGTAAPALGGVSRRFTPAPADLEEKTPPGKAEQLFPLEPDAPDIPSPASTIKPPQNFRSLLNRVQARATGTRPASDKSAGSAPRPGAAGPVIAAATRIASSSRSAKVSLDDDERERMTIFGARGPDSAAATPGGLDGRPRKVGLAATATLLLVLVGLAAWAAVFVEDGPVARLLAGRAPDIPVQMDELAREPELPSDGAADGATAPSVSPETLPQPKRVDPEAGEAAVRTVAVDEDIQPPEETTLEENTGGFDVDEAKAQYAVTGIWSIPPVVPEPPGLLQLDDLYMTSIDPANLSVDAVALAPQDTLLPDTPLQDPGDPAPPGTTFDLDDRGLVLPTPEGALSPDGVLVHRGAPPAVPPRFPNRGEAEAPQVAPDAPEAQPQPELSGFRPRARPDDLAETNERSRLGGLSRSELAEYRPKLRPQTAQEAQEAAEPEAPPTAQATATSFRPETRPSGFDRIVARAVQNRTRTASAAETDDQPERVAAAVAPATVAPRVPSRSSVAKEATVRNALNLNRINLMGVYGTPSNRRALVRLSNGRYRKVKVGDRIDGGRVSAIGDSELQYRKGSRNVVLRMPRT